MSEYGVVTAPQTVRFERLLPGPIERVWSYLTESEKRGTWLASGDVDLREGGRVEHIFRNATLTKDDEGPPAKYAHEAAEVRTEGRITACDPPRLLAHTWPEPSGPESHVTYELSEQGDRVLLVLTHRRLATRDDMVGVSGGWHTHLGILAARLEGREPEGFWATFKRVDAEYERRVPA